MVILRVYQRFLAQIDHAYKYANATLLHVLLDDRHLMDRLNSLKHHFFLDQGDWFTHFLDNASHELSKKSKHISLTKLQSLFDLAIRNPSSSSSGDPYKEDVKVALSSSTLTDWLMRIVSVSGAAGMDDAGHLDSIGQPPEDVHRDDEKEDKNSLTGM